MYYTYIYIYIFIYIYIPTYKYGELVVRNNTHRGLYWPRPLEYCFQNDTVRMGEPASDHARRQHAGEFNDAAQLSIFFHRFRAVRRIRNPAQVSVNNICHEPDEILHSNALRAYTWFIVNNYHLFVVIIAHAFVCVCVCFSVLTRVQCVSKLIFISI